jgi:hypothetical protein
VLPDIEKADYDIEKIGQIPNLSDRFGGLCRGPQFPAAAFSAVPANAVFPVDLYNRAPAAAETACDIGE